MTTIQRGNRSFEVTFQRSGSVRLRQHSNGTTVDHGEVCRWARIVTPRRIYAQLYDGIFPPRAPDYLPDTAGSLLARSAAPAGVVERWIQAAIEAVLDRGLVYARDGAVVYESIIARDHPAVDIPLLCDLFGDSLGDHRAVVTGYLQATAPAPEVQ